VVIKVARVVFGINNLRNLPLAFGTCQTILISIPFVGAGMAIHYLTPRGRVEVAMPFDLRRHLLRLIALVSSQGA
jgi:hypothetical protein